MNIVVYFDGVMLNPGKPFRCAHGIARRVNKLPAAPKRATKMHLNTQIQLVICNFGNLQLWQFATLAICNFGNLQLWQFAALAICNFGSLKY
jgi:hypothetical protein